MGEERKESRVKKAQEKSLLAPNIKCLIHIPLVSEKLSLLFFFCNSWDLI